MSDRPMAAINTIIAPNLTAGVAFYAFLVPYRLNLVQMSKKFLEGPYFVGASVRYKGY
jgi:hypothetical protein